MDAMHSIYSIQIMLFFIEITMYGRNKTLDHGKNAFILHIDEITIIWLFWKFLLVDPDNYLTNNAKNASDYNNDTLSFGRFSLEVR